LQTSTSSAMSPAAGSGQIELTDCPRDRWRSPGIAGVESRRSRRMWWG
jgi:hypothetical protein